MSYYSGALKLLPMQYETIETYDKVLWKPNFIPKNILSAIKNRIVI